MECHVDASMNSLDFKDDNDTLSVISDFSLVSEEIPHGSEQVASSRPPGSKQHDEFQPQDCQEPAFDWADESTVADMDQFRATYRKQFNEMLTILDSSFDSDDKGEFEEMQQVLYGRIEQIVATEGLNATSENTIKLLYRNLGLQKEQHESQIRMMELFVRQLQECLKGEKAIIKVKIRETSELRELLTRETHIRETITQRYEQAMSRWGSHSTIYRRQLSAMELKFDNSHKSYKAQAEMAVEELDKRLQELHECEKSAEDIADKLASAEDRETKARECIEKLTIELEDFKAEALDEVSTLKGGLQSAEKDLEDAQVDNQKIANQFNYLERTSKEEVTKLQAQSEATRLEIKQLNSDKEAFSAQFVERNRMLEESKAAVDELKSHVEKAERLKEEAVKKEAVTFTHFTDLKKWLIDLTHVKCRLENETSRLKDQLKTSQAQCLKLGFENCELNKYHLRNELEAKPEALTNKLAQISKLNDEYRESNKQLLDHLATCNLQHTESDAQLAWLSSLATNYERQMYQMEADHSEVVLERDQLKEDHKKAVQKWDQLRTDYDKGLEAGSQLERHYGAAVQKCDRLVKQIQEMNDDHTDMATKLTNSQELCRKYDLQLQGHSQTLNAYEARFWKALEDMRHVHKIHYKGAYEKKVEGALKKCKDLQAEVQRLEKELEDRDKAEAEKQIVKG